MSRAVVATAYGGPEVLQLVDVDPGDPGPGQVLLEVRAAGVNPADWKQVSGLWGTDPQALPLRVGHEAAGVVLGVGPDVEGVAVGDQVIAHRAPGAYAERLVLRTTALVPMPPAMGWPEAAGLMVAGTTAAHTLTATAVGPGDTVLVHGAGGAVGSMVTQLAIALGAQVIGTAGAHDHDHVAALGGLPVPYGPGLADRVRAVAPDGVTAAIDTVGTTEALETSVAVVADRGRIATIAGFEQGSRLGVRLLGAGPGADPGTAVRRAARGDLVRLWEEGAVRVRVGATYPLDRAADAHRAAMAGHVAGKVVLTTRA